MFVKTKTGLKVAISLAILLTLATVAALWFWQANPPEMSGSFDDGVSVRYKLLRFGSYMLLPQGAVACWLTAASYLWRARRGRPPGQPDAQSGAV